MKLDPFQRFLGVSADADEAALLGLTDDLRDVARIQAALKMRRQQIDAHPDGEGPEARVVISRLERAAAEMIARVGADRPARSRPSYAAPRPMLGVHLTSFDRQVLGVLVGSGGWNAASRSRIIMLAASHDVTPDGLIRIVTGLCQYAKSGGAHLDFRQITAGAVRLSRDTAAIAPENSRARLELLQRVPPVDEKPRGASVTAWVGGVMTVILSAGLVLFLASSRRLPIERESPPTVAPIIVEGPGASQSITAAASSTPGEAPFGKYPSFLGNGLPPEAARAADNMAELLTRLDGLQRRFEVSDDPSEAAFRDWDDCVGQLAIAWVLTDDSTRRAGRRAILDVLVEAAQTPGAASRLLRSLIPGDEHVARPLDLWRGAWFAGMLGLISETTVVPEEIAQRAASQLEAVSPNVRSVEAGFNRTGAAWLTSTLSPLIGLRDPDRAFDHWELWLSGHRRLGDSEQFQSALVEAMRAILLEPGLPTEPPHRLQVLGRLVLLADLDGSPRLRQGIAALLVDPAIPAADIRVFTRLIAAGGAARWFSDELLMPADADELFRRRVRDRIVAAWPAPTVLAVPQIAEGRSLQVDTEVAARWSELLARAVAEPLADTDEGRLAQLIITCRLSAAAAALAAQQPREASVLLDVVDRGLASDRSQAGVLRSQAPGADQVVGTEGQWAQSYAQVLNNTQERLKLLRVLRTTAGSDLGLLDAQTLVREVYRGAPHEVRSLASSIVIELFSGGERVGMEMLDQFADAPRNAQVYEVIERLTGELLPSGKSAAAIARARLALAEHVIELKGRRGTPADTAAQTIVDVYEQQASFLRGAGQAPMDPGAAAEAGRLLVDAWHGTAAPLITAAPLPAPLVDLQRRHLIRRQLAEGPIQQFVAAQLAVLDLAVYVLVAEQPALRGIASEVMAASAARRSTARHVLDQAVEAERTICRVWSHRMNGQPSRDADGSRP